MRGPSIVEILLLLAAAVIVIVFVGMSHADDMFSLGFHDGYAPHDPIVEQPPLAAPANAEDRRMVVINHSNEAIIGLAASPIDAPKWDYNMLGGDAIPVGSSRIADFDDDTGYCRYDLLAKGAAGGRWEKYNVNVCSGLSWTLK